MALFNAAAILEDTPEQKVIDLDFFVLPEDADTPTLTVEVSRKVCDLAEKAAYKYNNVVIKYRGGQPRGEVINEPRKYCKEVLEACYVDSTGLFEESSLKLVLALLRKEPRFAKRLAGKLIELFEHADLYSEDEDRKN